MGFFKRKKTWTGTQGENHVRQAEMRPEAAAHAPKAGGLPDLEPQASESLMILELSDLSFKSVLTSEL